MWGRSMRTPQRNGYEPPATPMYHHSNMRTPSVHTHEPGYRDPSVTPASFSGLNGSAGPQASTSHFFSRLFASLQPQASQRQSVHTSRRRLSRRRVSVRHARPGSLL